MEFELTGSWSKKQKEGMKNELKKVFKEAKMIQLNLVCPECGHNQKCELSEDFTEVLCINCGHLFEYETDQDFNSHTRTKGE